MTPMAKPAGAKTNVVRLLEAAGISHTVYTYPVDETDLSGEHTAAVLSLPPEMVYKTLVLRGERAGVFVCCIPCREEIDLRKAALTAGDKKCELLPTRDLLPATGYIRGGCSPIGMKRRYPLFFEEALLLSPSVVISGGTRGVMVEIASPQALIDLIGGTPADLIKV